MLDVIIGLLISSPIPVVVFGVIRLTMGKTFFPRSKAKYHRDLLTYIEYKRKKDMRRWGTLYRDEKDWNRKELESAVSEFANHSLACRQEVKDYRRGQGLMGYVRQHDSVEREQYIKELERELGMKKAEWWQ